MRSPVHAQVILDVKFAPRSVSAQVLTGFDARWYRQLFPNEARSRRILGAISAQSRRNLGSTSTRPRPRLAPLQAERTAEAQRHLTSYTDPFTGWVHINGSAYSVRQRSAWKASFDLETLSSCAEIFAETHADTPHVNDLGE